ncbi:MAG: DEAD/DEAH box helicase [Lactobacillales bacterium]|jgi:competence protein ComFA|nr:DEAD/DEAH box helicase [Lactobacillales bacterium]
MNLDKLIGRRLLTKELDDKSVKDLPFVNTMPAMIKINGEYKCMRCDSLIDKGTKTFDPIRKKYFYYCDNCIQMNRVDSDEHLFHIKEEDVLREAPTDKILTWKGKLTPGQEKISNELLETYQKREDLLVHAVTGAGKTEMLFAVIAQALKEGARVGIASPRIDVCLELFPRIEEAFSTTDAQLLYGGQTEDYRYTPLVVATTHQLLRFYQAFDLLIIDEVDSFPYAYDPSLNFAAKNVVRTDGCTVFLSATPNAQVMSDVASGKTKRTILSARYHKHALVVPKFIFSNKLRETINDGSIPRSLAKNIEKFRQEKWPLLIFCGEIKLMEKLEKILNKKYPGEIKSVHAGSSDRKEIVEEMRRGEVKILLTTTILERGVTFTGVNVIVLESNHRVFNSSSLVQISGRVGRKVERYDGEVLFIHDGVSEAMKLARKEIVEMNNLARKERLIG